MLRAFSSATGIFSAYVEAERIFLPLLFAGSALLTLWFCYHGSSPQYSLLLLAAIISTLVVLLKCNTSSLVFAGSLFFLASCYFFSQQTESWPDQLLLYNSSKVFDLLSPFPQRVLYTMYRQYPENALQAPAFGDFLYWDYTYFPLSTLPGVLAHTLGVQPRFIYLFFVFLFAQLLLIAQPGASGRLLHTLTLVTPVPFALFSAHLSANNSLIPLLFVVLLLGLAAQKKHPLFSALFLALALASHQSLLLPFLFLFLYLLWQRRFSVLLCTVPFLALLLGYHIVQNPQAFFLSTIYLHNGYIDKTYFEHYQSIAPLTLVGLCSSVFSLPPETILRWYPAAKMSYLIIPLSLALFLRKLPQRDAVATIRWGILTALLVLFCTKYSWIGARYYASLLIAYVLCSRSMFRSLEQSAERMRSWQLGTAFLLLLALGVYARSLVAQSFSFPRGSSMEFQLQRDAQSGTLEVFSLDEDSAQHKVSRLSFGTRAGMMLSGYGRQLWVLTPPGEYEVSMCSKDHCKQESVAISEARSFALRIPFLLKQTKNSEPLLGMGKVGALELNSFQQEIRNPESLSIKRTR